MNRGRNHLAHSLPIRIMHWIGAIAVICMILSGWQIYNASPLLPFTFPRWMTLGAWLGGGIAWHLSAMWVLFADGLAYLAYGILSGHFRRDILPPSAKDHTPRSGRCASVSARPPARLLQRRAAPALHGSDHRDLSGGRYRTLDLEARPARLAYRPVRRLPRGAHNPLDHDGSDRRLSHHTPGACHIVPAHARFDARSGSVRAGQCATRGRAMSRRRAAVRASDVAPELAQLGRRRFLKGG